MAVRITLDTVRSGQPRPYADSTEETYVLFEVTPWNKPGVFEPYDIKDASLNNIPRILSQYVPALRMPLRKDAGFLGPYLSAFGPAPSRGHGWYRYVVISPYTD